MGRMILPYLFLLQIVAAIIVYEPGYAAGSYPTVLYRQLWNNVDFSKFGKNYTVGNTAQSCRNYCSVAEANADGLFSFSSSQIACLDPFGNVRCSRYESVSIFQQLGAQACWDTLGAEAAMSWILPGPPLDGSTIPYFWPNSWAPDYFSYLPVFGTDINITFQLTFPELNPYESLQAFNGPLSWVRFLGLYCGIIVMCLSVFRWSTIFMITSAIRFDIPTIILGLNFFQGAMITFNALALNTFNGSSANPFPGTACEFFLYWSWSIIATQLMLLGFYFGEVARLTSAQSVPGLVYFRIPAVILLLALWVVTIVVGALDATTYTSSGGINELNVAVFSIVWAMAGFLCIWGIISIAMQLSGSSHSGALTRIIVLSGLIIVVFWALGFTFLAFQNYFLVIGVTLDEISVTSLPTLQVTLLVFSPVVVGGLVTFLFRAQMVKEIEVSKSGTSSTSGSSGSSGSSSSSKSADPVIEL